MVKSITNFIRGTVHIVSETSKCVQLSDGTQWNKRLFHQTRGLVSSFILREVDLDPEIQAVKARVLEQQSALFADSVKLRQSLSLHKLFKDSKILMPFGKYRGLTLGQLYNTDLAYYDWLFTQTKFDPYMVRHKVAPERVHNVEISDDDLPF